MRLPLDRSLIDPGDRVLVAVSGGADSLALLHALAAAREELGVFVAAAHVHHGMRGAAADEDVEFLRACCAEWRVPLEVRYADVPARAEAARVSVEEAGRDARYEALAEVAALHACGKVATAHHADDQAETILLNLFRGAGLDGLAGMPARRPLTPGAPTPELVRPLLGARRAALEEYCRRHGLEPRLDVTNLDLRYRRNRVRQELLPRLTEFDPAIVPHLLRLAEQARGEQALLDREAAALLAHARRPEPELPIPIPGGPPLPSLSTPVLLSAPEPLLRRALRIALRQAGGFDLELDALLVERVTALLRAASGAIDLPGCRVRVRRSGEFLTFEVEDRPVPDPIEIALPGRTRTDAFGFVLEGTVEPRPTELQLPPAEAILDPVALQAPFQLRAPQTGERFQPLNAPGTRLLSDLFVDRRIPRSLRPVWPVLSDAAGIVWVLGLAVAHRVRVREETREVLHLIVKALPSR
jgi:tRNA(Ile)-lysidine synthase